MPGIGPATAEKILQARKANGKFKSVNDLQTIRGIGPKRLEKMKKYLTVGPATQNQKAATRAPVPAKGPPAKKAIAKVPVAPGTPPPPASDKKES